MPDKTISDLEPTEFENLVYDVLCLAGLTNAVWRTPGADGGRDIEGVIAHIDFSGQTTQQKWYIECKRYSISIDWPTIYSKISYAHSNDADFLLLATNNNPSPQCETEINKWNSQRMGVKIRIWRGYYLENTLNYLPEVKMKYGIGKQDAQKTILRMRPLFFELMKVVQTAYSLTTFGNDGGRAIETGSAMAEFISEKVEQLEDIGGIYTGAQTGSAPAFPWLNWHNWEGQWSDAALRAILTFYRHVRQAEKIEVVQSANEAKVTAVLPRYKLCEPSTEVLRSLCFWSRLEMRTEADDALVIRRLSSR